ncbi:MAG: flagellar assembly protein FliH [Treponemataceae bacterium]|nr:flagellar assembly protein FliH [Treponemataceae bacterium]
MAKNVFTINEIKTLEDKVQLKPFRNFAPVEEEVEVIEEPVYEGPTADDLRREAELFKIEWEQEKERMLNEARAQADAIIKQAEQSAFEEVKRKTDQAAVIRQQAESDAAEIIKQAEAQSLEIIQEGEQKRERTVGDAYKDGFDKGIEDGYNEGKAEVQRLVERLHVINEKTMEKRQEILDSTEQQIVDLVLLITRKVVKVISDSQRQVVMQNVLQALKRVKGRGDVTIRVNLEDVKLTTEHTREFMAAVESVKSITVAEDSTVERGGCIVETDFGAIDARISSQLSELEQKILEIAPIKTVTKASGISE